MDILDQVQGNEPNRNDMQLAMWAHLIGLVSLLSGFLGLIGTLIFYFVNKDRHNFVRQHTAQALNFQITYFLAGLVIAFFTVGSLVGSFAGIARDAASHENPALPAAGLVAGFGLIAIVGVAMWVTNLVICIIASMKANKGESWKNPIAIPFIR